MNNAVCYSSSSHMQKKDAEQILSEYINKLNLCELKEFDVVDIGCGSGEVTSEVILPKLTSKGLKNIVGIDISQEMIEFAQKTHRHPRLSFYQLDISDNTDNLVEKLMEKQELSKQNGNAKRKDYFGSQRRVDGLTNDVTIMLNGKKLFQQTYNKNKLEYGRFDFAFSFYCLHWISDQRAALSNIHQLLKPGGEALLVLLARSPIFTLYSELSEIDEWKIYMKDVNNFISPYHNSSDSLHDFKKNLTDIGYTILECKCQRNTYSFSNVQSLQKSIKAVNPFLPRIPEDLQGQYMDDCLKKVEELKLTELNNNVYPVKYDLLIAHVKRPDKS